MMSSDSPSGPIANPEGESEALSPEMEIIVTATEELPSEHNHAPTVAIKVNYQLERMDFEETSARAVSPDSAHGEELEMLQAPLIEAHIEPGVELLSSIDTIPNKMAFKIGEAAEMVGVKQYVLRYWETEFEMLRPRKSKNNQRVYSRRDVETAMMIKKLLYDDRFSIEGARAALKSLKTQVKEDRGVKKMAESQETAVNKLRGLVTEIRRIRDLFI